MSPYRDAPVKSVEIDDETIRALRPRRVPVAVLALVLAIPVAPWGFSFSFYAAGEQRTLGIVGGLAITVMVAVTAALRINDKLVNQAPRTVAQGPVARDRPFTR